MNMLTATYTWHDVINLTTITTTRAEAANEWPAVDAESPDLGFYLRDESTTNGPVGGLLMWNRTTGVGFEGILVMFAGQTPEEEEAVREWAYRTHRDGALYPDCSLPDGRTWSEAVRPDEDVIVQVPEADGSRLNEYLVWMLPNRL